MKIKNVMLITCSDFDKLVSKTYGRPYCFQQQDGCKERGVYEFELPIAHPWDFKDNTVEEKFGSRDMGVSFNSWLSRDPELPVEGEHPALWWKRNFYPNIDVVLTDLYEKGLLKAGNYCIEIDW